jgi:hypothetical protein
LGCERTAPEAAVPEPTPEAVTSAPTDADLTSAAETIVRFLKGDTAFDAIATADTVTLRLTPEGGGTSRRVSRDSLRSLSSWHVRAPSGAVHSFAPPPPATQLTTRVGRHFNCREYSLESRFAELALLPHVGTKLEPQDTDSCLQSWNLTFVFSALPQTPILVEVIHDQWEW